MLTVQAAKAVVVRVLFVITFVLGLLPIGLMVAMQRRIAGGAVDRNQQKKMDTYRRILSFLSCFAAGVFLATCFLVLLPTVRKKIAIVLSSMADVTGFPLAEFITLVGLFLILIIEQVVLLFKEKRLMSRSGGAEIPLF